jgi:hypothetical protein
VLLGLNYEAKIWSAKYYYDGLDFVAEWQNITVFMSRFPNFFVNLMSQMMCSCLMSFVLQGSNWHLVHRCRAALRLPGPIHGQKLSSCWYWDFLSSVYDSWSRLGQPFGSSFFCYCLLLHWSSEILFWEQRCRFFQPMQTSDRSQCYACLESSRAGEICLLGVEPMVCLIWWKQAVLPFDCPCFGIQLGSHRSTYTTWPQGISFQIKSDGQLNFHLN